jgi:hypothetical protein
MWQIPLAMGAVALTWLVLGLLFAGLGCLVRRLFGLRELTGEALGLCFWVGWGSSIVLLQLWHFLWPVSRPAFVVILAFSLAGWVWSRRELWRLLRTRLAAGNVRWAFVALMAFFTLLWSNTALGPAYHYDTPLYHIASVRWIENYPVAPGLGNLHGRLAFNSSVFLYEALLDWGPWDRRAQHVANGLLVMAFFYQATLSLLKALDIHREERLFHVFRAALAPGIFFYLRLHIFVSSLSPDVPALVLGAVVVSEAFWFLSAKRQTNADTTFRLYALALLGSVLVTVRLNLLVFAALSVGVALAAQMRRDGALATLRAGRLWVCLAGAVLLTLGAWAARGVVLSGYPAYPLTLGGMQVEWRVPEQQAKQDWEAIRGWARRTGMDPREVLGGWGWLWHWLNRLNDARPWTVFVYPLLAGLVSAALAAFLRMRRALGAASGTAARAAGTWSARTDRSARPTGTAAGTAGPWLILPVGLAAGVFWFLSAPDVRFAGIVFWTVAAGGLAVLAHEWPFRPNVHVLRACLALSCLWLAFMFVRFEQEVAREWAESGGKPMPAFLLLRPGPDHGMVPFPPAKVVPYRTRSGLTVYIPDSVSDQCWDAPLPCAPAGRRELRLRREGDLRSGFVLEQRGRP